MFIFTDESSVWMETHEKICFGRIGELPKQKPKVKHLYKIHVWAGISTRGASDILLFTGIMRKEFYVDKILCGQLLPFIKECFPDGNYRFQQDNDPKHKSKLAYSSFYIFSDLGIFDVFFLTRSFLHCLDHFYIVYIVSTLQLIS